MNFRADRINAGESIRTRAARIGIDPRTLGKLEQDGLMPAEPVAKAVADFYEQRVTDLWPLDTEPTEAAA